MKYQNNNIFCLGDPCSDWECLNGGHCVWQNEPNFLPRCQCEYDYEGPHCETSKLYSDQKYYESIKDIMLFISDYLIISNFN